MLNWQKKKKKKMEPTKLSIDFYKHLLKESNDQANDSS